MVIKVRFRNVKNKDEIINNSAIVVKDSKDHKGKWQEYFGNDKPIHLEIGIGMGSFIKNSAINNPDINYIGIEKAVSIIARAIQKIEEVELSNIRIIGMDASYIEDCFDKDIDCLYLNFSDPWPKKKHAARRLTSEDFLKRYDNIFRSSKKIFLKTDNYNLFAFSLKTLVNHGYKIDKVSYDLHNSDIENNIMTEYEERFVKKGMKINYLEASSNV